MRGYFTDLAALMIAVATMNESKVHALKGMHTGIKPFTAQPSLKTRCAVPKNQRQRRKKLRQNPSLRRKKS